MKQTTPQDIRRACGTQNEEGKYHAEDMRGMVGEYCEWKPCKEANWSGYWSTGCGAEFKQESNFLYCPNCSRKIEEKPQDIRRTCGNSD